MNNTVRERMVEISLTAAMAAVLVTAVSFGIHFIDRNETQRISRELIPLAEKGLGVSANGLTQREIKPRSSTQIQRAYIYENKHGKLLGVGFSISFDSLNNGSGLFVVTDGEGRIRSTGVWPGISGIRAEELQTYLKQREKGTTGGLDHAANIRSMEFSVNMALDEAIRFLRSWEGSEK